MVCSHLGVLVYASLWCCSHSATVLVSRVNCSLAPIHICSVETFERQLETAQRELGLDERDFVTVRFARSPARANLRRNASHRADLCVNMHARALRKNDNCA
jgi:hypothetical protein